MKKVWTILLIAAALAAAMNATALEYTIDDDASEVSLIQEALLSLDFYYGDITGHYGERTARGVRMFQEAYGLDVTGVADDATRARLYQVTGMTPPNLSDMLIEMEVTLRQGDSGSAVTWLQESLAELGYYDGEISGSYGRMTKEAVRLFQRAVNLSSDGVAGRNTIRQLAQAIEAKKRAEETPPVDEGFLWEGDASDDEQTALDQESITTLRLDVRNSAVRKLQEDLTELGFYTGEITGKFGRLTKEAVRLFQRAHDIPSDGVAGPVTLAAVAQEIADKRALEEALRATPTPAPTADPYSGFITYITPAPTATPDRYNGLVTLITPAPNPTATAAPTAKPIVGINSSVGFLSIEREMKLYDQSEDVRQLQIALNALGYYSASASGYFDLQTQAAVMGYQAAKGLTVSGAANKVTLITINDDIFRRLVNAVD